MYCPKKNEEGTVSVEKRKDHSDLIVNLSFMCPWSLSFGGQSLHSLDGGLLQNKTYIHTQWCPNFQYFKNNCAIDCYKHLVMKPPLGLTNKFVPGASGGTFKALQLLTAGECHRLVLRGPENKVCLWLLLTCFSAMATKLLQGCKQCNLVLINRSPSSKWLNEDSWYRWGGRWVL